MSFRHVMTSLAAFAAVCTAGTGGFGAAQAARVQAVAQSPAGVPNDLDTFMAKVLEKRNENWRTLHDYILSERETFQVLGPGGLPLHGLRREFDWFIREGYLIRSPVKANGVEVTEAERKKYEDRWFAEELKREKRAAEKDEKRKVELSMSVTGDVQFSGFAGPGIEPRFISEAYFMKFKFEPGNYYFAGRELLDGREVLKIEYLPSKMFDEEPKPSKSDTKAAPAEPKAEPKPASGKSEPPRKARKEAAGPDDEEKIDRAMNKTSAVTMWIDPQEHQIVRFRFDNVDWGFLPGRQLARVDEARASMTMGRVFEGIWLPKDVTFTGAVTFAPGTLRFTYSRDFFGYRRGEVSAKIRGYVPREPQS